MNRPCLVLNSRGRILHRNALADRFLSEVLSASVADLILTDAASQERLQAVLKLALEQRIVDPGRHSTTTTVRNPSGGFYTVHAIALRGWSKFTFTDARVLLIWEQPDRQMAPLSHARAKFGLSVAEGKVAIEIGSGASLAQAADKLHISYETARSVLKVIFSKTDTHRQGQLVALLTSQPSGQIWARGSGFTASDDHRHPAA
jgi:DNA-binding CsgD family transcriptional regulator